MNFKKPENPFFPDKPLPPSKFYGRNELIHQIFLRNLQPLIDFSRSSMIWIYGERGIGKTSLADFLISKLEEENIFCLKIDLSRIKTTEQLIETIIKQIIGILNKTEKGPLVDFLNEAFKRYIESFELVPLLESVKIKIRTDRLKEDLPNYVMNFDKFLMNFALKLKEKANYYGFLLVLDEINGLAKESDFANLLKGLSDNLGHNCGVSIMICGTREKREQVVQNHPSTDRIFSMYEVFTLEIGEVARYISEEFKHCNINFPARHSLSEYSTSTEFIANLSSCQPKIIQLFCRNIYDVNTDEKIDKLDVALGFGKTQHDIKEYFIKGAYSDIQSKDYKQILSLILDNEEIQQLGFSRKELIPRLKKAVLDAKFDNFIQRMKKLKFIKEIEKGEYEFDSYFTKAALELCITEDKNLTKSLKKHK
ncbi:MAG: ATP-binding protein [Candidatus Caenarcaniphilales bacterium]|nr:ATP-binding protein [Candidatus Caenarcaniphilales bacterium]